MEVNISTQFKFRNKLFGCLRQVGCLTEVNISTQLKFRNKLFGCLRQVGCLIEVTANAMFDLLKIQFSNGNIAGVGAGDIVVSEVIEGVVFCTKTLGKIKCDVSGATL